MLESLKQTWYGILLNALSSTKPSRDVVRIHDYSHERQGTDYFFESISGKNLAYMTGQRGGIQTHDYLLLRQGDQVVTYQVQAIDYYASPSDMWIASLSKTTSPHIQ